MKAAEVAEAEAKAAEVEAAEAAEAKTVAAAAAPEEAETAAAEAAAAPEPAADDAKSGGDSHAYDDAKPADAERLHERAQEKAASQHEVLSLWCLIRHHECRIVCPDARRGHISGRALRGAPFAPQK